MKYSLKLTLLYILFSFTQLPSIGQHFRLSGTIKDLQSDEPIPFASVQFKKNGKGILTDSAGQFTLEILYWAGTDTLEVNSVGYKKLLLPVTNKKDSLKLAILLEVMPSGVEATVKSKYNRSLWFWRKLIKNKPKNDCTRWNGFAYEIYNKLEIDLNNVKKDKLEKFKLLKPFDFVLENIDSTTETKAFLPLFITETISDYYYQKNPKKIREVIKASRTNGIGIESVTKLLGGMYQQINVYNNFIPVFDKQFVSPFNDNGDAWYTFKLADTQYLNKKRLIHLRFTPRRKGQDTFEGDCWIHDSSFAIQKITLRPSGEANINFIEGLSLIQEYSLVNDSIWFLHKDKFVVDISPIGKSNTGFKGRKTSTYKDIILNPSDKTELEKNKRNEEVIVEKDAEEKAEKYWQTNRHEELNTTEKGIYKMIDSIQKHPQFAKYTQRINFIATGYKNIGNYQIGPWFNWISANGWEGTRFRFDLGTNVHFNRKIYLHGYAAYGTRDGKFKGKAEIFYLPKKDPRFYIYASYTQDLDNGQHYYDEISTDNIFTLAARKANIPIKNMLIDEKRIEVFKETPLGFSFHFSAVDKRFNPLRNLPSKDNFISAINEPLHNFETSIRIRFAYLEKFLENNFFRTSLGSDLPITEIRISKGWPNVMGSSYDYYKISGSISDYLKLPPYGSIYFNLFAGKIFSNTALPFPVLEVHPGNEIYYYNKYAFNLMNRFEFISDRYTGFNVEHNIGNGLFRFIPLTRKLKFRQFWSIKGVVGGLTKANEDLNFIGTHSFQNLNDRMYIEAGTGVDNIFKVFRIDFIWRLFPRPLPAIQQQRFGIFGSFRLAF